MKPKAYVSEKKKKEVTELASLLEQYPIVGVVDLTNLPALQFQRMREQLRGDVLIRTSKARLIRIALDNVKSKPKIEELKEHVKGMPALILTRENPFKLFKILEKNKSSAPAKAGQKAPKDIVIPAGETSFSPGPILSELGSFGIKTAIEKGKVVIKEDKVVAKEGDTIDAKKAALLMRMGIEPMEVGLNLQAVYEDGTIYLKSILAVDEEEYINNIKQLSAEALNLAVYISYTTKDTIDLLLKKAQAEAISLADSQDIVTDANVEKILAKAEMQANALKLKEKN